ncbi:MAG: VPLPA-CTERM sorting domain-containing protein [Candidatus Methylumidiphilus sp.]
MQKNRLTQAMATAMQAATLVVVGIAGASASTTMYNTFNAGLAPGQGGTDGWVYGRSNATYPTASPGWVGTVTSTTLPFGYVGASALNWAVEITNPGDAVEISRADAVARYSVEADIDTAKGAWQDGEAEPQGWAHNTDIGLFRSAVNTYVTLRPTSVNNVFADFGITVFTGMDTLTHLNDGIDPTVPPGSGYSHHTGWNSPTKVPPEGKDFTQSDPFGTLGVNYVDGLGVGNGGASYSAIVNTSSPFTFLAQANQVYSIYLGGSNSAVNNWTTPRDFYALNITTAPVPIPAAAWLMGSGLLGILGFARRKQRT